MALIVEKGVRPGLSGPAAHPATIGVGLVVKPSAAAPAELVELLRCGGGAGERESSFAGGLLAPPSAAQRSNSGQSSVEIHFASRCCGDGSRSNKAPAAAEGEGWPARASAQSSVVIHESSGLGFSLPLSAGGRVAPVMPARARDGGRSAHVAWTCRSSLRDEMR